MDPFVIYVAGLFDGEGSVSVSRTPPRKTTKSPLPVYRIQCIMGMVNPSALKLIHARWGGCLRLRANQRPNQRDSWYWSIAARKASVFLRDVHPHLIVKREIVDVALQMQDELTAAYDKRFRKAVMGFASLPFNETMARRDALYNQAKNLNQRGRSS